MSTQGTIFNQPGKILFDTGSEVTLISKEYFDSLNSSIEIAKPRCDKIQAVNNETMELIGMVKLPLKFINFELLVTFHIVPYINHDIIFGRNEMNSQVRCINYELSLITFNNAQTSINECNIIQRNNIQIKGFLNEEITILPHSVIQTFLHAEISNTEAEF